MAKQNPLTRSRKKKAFVLLQQGDLPQARVLLEQVCRADKLDLQAWQALGSLYGMLDLFSDAEHCFRHIIQIESTHAEGLAGLARALQALGRGAEALEFAAHVVRLAPENAIYQYDLAVTLMSLGRFAAAREHLEHALRINPGDYQAGMNLGLVLHTLGDDEAALPFIEKAIALRPDEATSYNNLGQVLASLQRFDEAQQAYQAALDRQPDFADVYNNLANLQKQQGQLTVALENYGKAIAYGLTDAHVYCNQGVLQRALGQTEAAIVSFTEALRQAPGFAEAWYQLGLLQTYPVGDARIRTMQALLEQPDVTSEQQVFLNFALGKVFEDQGLYEKSFVYYAQGNQLRRQGYDYKSADEEQQFARIQAAYSSRQSVATQESTGITDSTPIFVVGMPRSGSSLVEQILASHPQVYGAGECGAFARAVTALCDRRGVPEFPECGPMLSATDLEALGTHCIMHLRAHAPDALHIIDKMPQQFLYIGLIRQVLPAARIIHCRRDPMATCWSIYKHNFTTGHLYAYDLQELGAYYRRYDKLMAHWQALWPEALLEVRYEDLIRDQEGVTRRMLAYCDLAWDPACLEFYKTARPVQTASASQVRQPLYHNAVEQWRAYADYLERLREALALDE